MSANVEYRKDGLSAIWRDLTAEPVWKYEELPPLLLPDLTGLDLFELGDTELARAHWFWSRRPKLTFPERAAVMIVALCVLICLSIALVYWHHTSVLKRAVEMIIVLFEVAVEIYAIGHRLEFLRWRREYERSIDRLIRTHHAGM
ncbi:MAG: hypothetical protein WAK31_29765 [Chthoniobacterales bacterium]